MNFQLLSTQWHDDLLPTQGLEDHILWDTDWAMACWHGMVIQNMTFPFGPSLGPLKALDLEGPVLSHWSVFNRVHDLDKDSIVLSAIVVPKKCAGISGTEQHTELHLVQKVPGRRERAC